MKTLLIALNPQAGAVSARERVAELERLLRAAGRRVVIEPDLGRLADRARELHGAGELEGVVSAGGDGTAAAVVNLLPPQVPIALFPLGTENLLGRWLGQQATPAAVRDTILGGRILRLDAAQANGRLFLLMLGAGFDAAVVQRMHQRRRGHIRRWHYSRPILETLHLYRFPELRVTCSVVAADAPVDHGAARAPAEASSLEFRARWVFAFNLPCYAAGLPLALEADGADGALDLTTFERGSIWHGLRYLASVILRRHHQLAEHATFRVTRLRIEADELVPYQVDGDPGGVLPVDVEVLPGRLALFAPPGAP